jgi:peptidoglycan/xylan/chitin deacetylase (PgdA/CDA1 family)
MLKQLKSLAKAVVSPMMDATGFYGRRMHRVVDMPGTWTIVMYHRVIEDRSLDPFELGMCVLRERFERQIRYLRSHFSILTVGEAVRRVAAGRPLPRRALSITFDDGYLDNLTVALPVLQRHRVPFSLYVPTGGLDDGQPLWWDRVIAALACTEHADIDLQEVGLAGEPARLPLKGVYAADSAERILALLWSLDSLSCEDCVERIARVLGPFDASRLRAERLSPPQLLELRRRGVEIGAHSVHHGNLELACAEDVRSEMHDSRTWLENLLQERVPGFAYPAGRFNNDALRLSRELGFDYALSTQSGANPPPLDLMFLHRIGMPDTDLADFRRAFSAALLRTQVDNHLHF